METGFIEGRVAIYLATHKGATRQGIADVLGITYQSLKNKLDGRTEFTLSEAKKLADLLGCKLEMLDQPVSVN